jgi:hypothetical protein
VTNDKGCRKLSPVVERYFASWIDSDTWWKRHPSDEAAFYRFVHAVVRYSKHRVDETDLKDLIIERCTGTLHAEYLEQQAIHYAGLYMHLCDFSAYTGFPNTFIGKTNIIQYLGELESQMSKAEPSRIAELMVQAWGPDWIENYRQRATTPVDYRLRRYLE